MSKQKILYTEVDDSGNERVVYNYSSDNDIFTKNCVKVVRCGKCGYFDQKQESCGMWNSRVLPNEYCSRGVEIEK